MVNRQVTDLVSGKGNAECSTVQLWIMTANLRWRVIYIHHLNGDDLYLSE